VCRRGQVTLDLLDLDARKQSSSKVLVHGLPKIGASFAFTKQRDLQRGDDVKEGFVRTLADKVVGFARLVTISFVLVAYTTFAPRELLDDAAESDVDEA
jgi:hypothetical protein